MKDRMGLEVPDALMSSAASSSAVPPISPIMMMPSVCTRNLLDSEYSLGGFRMRTYDDHLYEYITLFPAIQG